MLPPSKWAAFQARPPNERSAGKKSYKSKLQQRRHWADSRLFLTYRWPRTPKNGRKTKPKKPCATLKQEDPWCQTRTDFSIATDGPPRRTTRLKGSCPRTPVSKPSSTKVCIMPSQSPRRLLRRIFTRMQSVCFFRSRKNSSVCSSRSSSQEHKTKTRSTCPKSSWSCWICPKSSC